MNLTILTPIYNRGEKLKVLYKSLCNQTNKEFLWYIVDDGSTDNIEEIVNAFIQEEKISIKFDKKQNGGKHTALNYAMKKIDTELVFIVDSDDWLTVDAIEKVLDIHEKYIDRKDICGYSFLRKFSTEKINGKVLEQDEVIDNYIDIRINGKDTNSDKAEVWKTRILKGNPFPEFDGERFLGEDVIWIKLACDYNMVFLKDAIYVSEYLSDGLTKNRRRNNILSPNGCFYRAKLILDISKIKNMEIKYLIKNILQYIIYGKFAGKSAKEMYQVCNKKISFILLYPVAFGIYNKWKIKYL